jgi:phytoene/squalene synthetase
MHMMDISFYQAHLDRVSRSFAFCIKKLESPFRGWVSLAYLLCRVLDTVEDSIWTDSKLRDAQFADFDSFLEKLPSQEKVAAWSAQFPSSIPEGEKDLLKETHLLFQDLHKLPIKVKTAMQERIQEMSSGMKDYSTRTKNGSLRLLDLSDVNRYCYFVAGIVGELLTKLLMEFRSDFIPAPETMKDAVHFGLFLQKINLLKDQKGDEIEGRFLVPHREELLASLFENAKGALTYVKALPLVEKGYRTFCAWSLFLGAASLDWINKGSKIPRAVTEKLLTKIESIVTDNIALEAAFQEYFLRSFPVCR